MARKQKAKGLNRFLDLIGLVDSDRENEEFDPEFDQPRSTRGSRINRNAPIDDEFAEEPRMARASSGRRERPAASHASSYSSGSSRFDGEDEWQTGGARPDYNSARTQHRSTASRSSASGRYGSEQRYGMGSQSRASRYAENAQTDDFYRSSAASQRQGASSYGSYGASSRWSDENAYGSSQETYPQQAGGYQRHQTVIFKLHSVDECKDVILALIEKKSVLLNLDELDSLQAQRALDTMSGATFAIGAMLSRASDRTWLITPSTVDVASSQMEDNSYGGRYM